MIYKMWDFFYLQRATLTRCWEIKKQSRQIIWWNHKKTTQKTASYTELGG